MMGQTKVLLVTSRPTALSDGVTYLDTTRAAEQRHARRWVRGLRVKVCPTTGNDIRVYHRGIEFVMHKFAVPKFDVVGSCYGKSEIKNFSQHALLPRWLRSLFIFLCVFKSIFCIASFGSLLRRIMLRVSFFVVAVSRRSLLPFPHVTSPIPRSNTEGEPEQHSVGLEIKCPP